MEYINLARGANPLGLDFGDRLTLTHQHLDECRDHSAARPTQVHCR